MKKPSVKKSKKNNLGMCHNCLQGHPRISDTVLVLKTDIEGKEVYLCIECYENPERVELGHCESCGEFWHLVQHKICHGCLEALFLKMEAEEAENNSNASLELSLCG